MTWVAVAVAIHRVLPNLASRFTFVIAAVGVAVLVGLTRIYLRAQWLSDVTGGWGIGAAVFALCGLVALVVAYVRENARDAPRRPAPETT
jgi:undecaprenyl-diphosphatase